MFLSFFLSGKFSLWAAAAAEGGGGRGAEGLSGAQAVDSCVPGQQLNTPHSLGAALEGK